MPNKSEESSTDSQKSAVQTKSLGNLKPAKGAVRRKKREGRGHAGYGGKTAGKGMNGQKSRKSPDVRSQFEGGQTPGYRRLPKKQFMPAYNRVTFTILNLAQLEILSEEFAAQQITPELLLEKKHIKKLEKGGLKLLAKGELSKKINIKVHACSQSAKEKIEAVGGSVELIA